MAIPPGDFQKMVAARRDECVKFKDDKLSLSRLHALRFYRGDNLSIYGNSGDGLSTVVSRDLMEAVEAVIPGLVKPFIAGDEMVRFEPVGPEDEEPAKQATEYINYLFQNHNDAVRVTYDFTKDGLLYRLGVAKVVHEIIEDQELQSYQGIDAMGLAAIEAEEGSDLVGDIIDNGDGTFDCKCSHTVQRSMYRVYVIAPDEFLFEERLASLDEGRFFGHRSTKPIGDFIAMGLPKAKVIKLKSGVEKTQEADDRFDYEQYRDEGSDEDDLARLVTIDECYIRCDYEKTGVLVWRRVFIGANGSDILLDEEADDHPYCAWTPIPVPHKLIGMSIYDLVRDLQMQGTALLRESMNALYLANRPQREVVEGQVNFEDLLNPEIGGLVRVKAPGMVREIQSGGEGVLQNSLAMLEQIATIREQRTGSTRYNQGLDANSLNKTATGISIIQNASTQRQELVARMLAEGMKAIFRKMLYLVCRYGDKKEVIRLRGQWVEMDPNEWKTDYDMSVSVGLGTGNRDQQVGQLTNLLNIDKEIIQLQGGANGPIVTMENVYEKLKRMVEAMGMKGVEAYYTDPASAPPKPPQPSDEEAQAQADVQKFQAQSERDIQQAQIKANTAIEVARIQAETQLIIAGFQTPPELHADAGQPEVQPEASQEPTEEPIHEPSYVLGALHGASMASAEPSDAGETQ